MDLITDIGCHLRAVKKRDGGSKRQRRFNRDAESIEGVRKWGGGSPSPSD